ncbi:MAG: TRAP transporter substrate-binding protein [Paracoccus sp. (in: a-proteobacteria)]|jgi:TRAP-type C4-dicarboxylate transport system substrate-binding protein|uniref:TRAP transporter substrate-binding protein n=1 Tax=unclassified Paracoccus (in: a-proteobacteria) TaxID=2688777 RepID=UPI000C3F98E6|nr:MULTISPECIES: TRAP transporter substrate-binding protein [unclassified Paracoccus (in: a-proteobacteria)]MAN55777.1 C4-dicarboxylate ABC transporter substrate-binding protein [Paracoccus sp. (in: a-proteobacteria)]MBA49784.1 C4-dicarboxylate ABC transporter substrate-binding protein [Paracoccus sp. (in: a-proteobacteria)]MCS5602325.1 TRAP transporter substrate-binding protein [Paracoccus sp. (in: a-proteobacteria)]MDB2490407.1 TRAP transporter substrate-binding protein [Paracoccus sp. (in: a|tara:strand:- start:655 stop:1680 length:1026 start_codon:yes stop_codon:yes gene_type:complete
MTNLTRRTLLAATAVMALAAPALAAEYEFKFQSSDPAGNPNFELQKTWVEDVAQKSDGRIAIDLLPVDSIVAYNETQDAIATGIIDGHVTDLSYFAGKDPAFGLMGNPVGAWSDPQQMLDFVANGGGKELLNEIENPYGLQFIGATTPGLEAFVSAKPLDGVDDLKGLKMRAPEGLVQEVFAAAGAAPVNLPGSEVFTSLDKNVIDAADYSVFSTNQAQGLNDVAPHPVYPGFHSLPLVEISMNKAKWDELPEDLQQVMTQSVADFAQRQIKALAEADEKAVAAAKEGGKIMIHDWSDEERAKFRKIAMGEWEKVASQSPAAQKVYDTLTAYLNEKGLVQQ